MSAYERPRIDDIGGLLELTEGNKPKFGPVVPAVPAYKNKRGRGRKHGTDSSDSSSSGTRGGFS